MLIRKGRVFSSSHVWIWELDRKEGWVLKNWCFWTTLLQKIRESPLNGKEIKPVNLKGNQPWIFIGRTNAETAILWPPDVAIREERPWCWERLRAGGEGGTEDEMVGWHHWFNGHEFEQAPGDGEGQGGLVCCSPWGCKESDATELLNNREQLNILIKTDHEQKKNKMCYILHQPREGKKIIYR